MYRILQSNPKLCIFYRGMSMETEQLYGLLEKIIFNETEFAILKESIVSLNSGEITSKELRNIIFKNRIRILEDLIDFFPFYLNHFSSKNLVDVSNKDLKENKELEKRIKKREELLELVGKKINNILTNIKK